MIELIGNEYVPEKTAVALGLFDGLHHGHRKVIAEILDKSAPTVFTFRTESIQYKHGKPLEYIYTNEQKLKILEKMGVKYVYSPDFDAVKDMDGEEFAKEILAGRLNAEYVVCGENFRFGKKALYDVTDLKELGKKYGFIVKIISLDGFSSEKYRQLLREGNVEELCRNNDRYILSAEVVDGNRIGRTLDFPTINQHFAKEQIIPKRGVYHTYTLIEGRILPSITNVGIKPTVGGESRPLAETHILDYSGNLYGECIDVEFCRFIRSEMKFASLEELKSAIQADIDNCREYLQNIKSKE